MKTIIAGSRNFTNFPTFEKLVKIIGFRPTLIISGHANGADKQGEKYAQENNIPLKVFPAQWNDIHNKPKHQIGCNQYGKYWKLAGFERNKKMLDIAECLVAFWDGKSSGTKHMIKIARKRGIKVIIIYETGVINEK